jgi:hypothetical protein
VASERVGNGSVVANVAAVMSEFILIGKKPGNCQ